MSAHPPVAREAAWQILARWPDGVLLDSHFAASAARLGLDPRRRATARALVWGVVRHRGTLDHLLDHWLDRPRRVSPGLRQVLRLGAYQLLLAADVPAHAAVSSSVELARRTGSGRLTGLVNAVLRKVGGVIEGPLASARPVDSRRDLPRPDDVPLRLSEPLFPDPTADPVGNLAARYSYPGWLVARWHAALGPAVEARLAAGNRQPPLTLRVNPRRTTRAALRAALARAGVEAQDVPERPDALWLPAGGAPDRLPGFADGWFSVQDASAMAVVGALALRPGQRVLEVAAAPGGKTTQLLETVCRVRLLALDARPSRLARVADNLGRLGLSGASLVVARGEQLPLRGRFDAVLLDAPCSNTGVVGRRVDLRWRLTPDQLPTLVALQAALLEAAAAAVRPGGQLLYSTCSIEPEENQRQQERASAAHPSLALQREHAFLPESAWPGAGGYLALWRRTTGGG